MSNIKYIPQNQRDLRWGLTVTSTGHQIIQPGEEYPPPGHKHEYMFSPYKGRVLSEYQLLYIVGGRGTLLTNGGGKNEVKSGDMFLLFPGEWHSYMPDPEYGWNEYWIGFSGMNIDYRVENGFFSKEQPLYHLGYDEYTVNLYLKAIDAAKRQEPCFQQLLAGIVNHLLGIVAMSRGKQTAGTSEYTLDIINKAKNMMIELIEEDISIPYIAESLNMGYSKFRKLFKQITGQSPGQYFIELRLSRAKEMLRNTNASIKEISVTLHFENTEYFSAQFRKRTGMTPSQFRNGNIRAVTSPQL